MVVWGETARLSTEDWPNWYPRRESQCDDTHQNMAEVCPVKKCSDSVERSKRNGEWVRNVKCSLSKDYYIIPSWNPN